MRDLVLDVLAGFPEVREDQVALVMVDPNDAWHDFRGDIAFYPASVIKLFYLAAGATRMDAEQLALTPDGQNAFREMIEESDNDATALVVDLLTGTTSGPELSPDDFNAFRFARESVNRFFAERGYPLVNACQKTWSFGPYGRDRQLYETAPGSQVQPNCGTGEFVNRNSLTPRDAVRLMRQIVAEKWSGVDSTVWMKTILERTPGGDLQDRDFAGAVLPPSARRWSKSGWTSTTRHDVVHVQLDDRRELTIAVFTNDHPNEPAILQSLAAAALSFAIK
jgi:beta-lactamase class A